MSQRYGQSIGNILHPTDFSQGSFVAFAHAMKIVLALQGKLTLLHVDPDRKATDWNAYPSVRGLLNEWGALPHDASRSDVGDLGLQIRKASIEDENPADGILTYLRDHPADLIVMATHQRTGLARWMHQEIAGRMTSGTDAAALFIPYGCNGFVDPATGRSTLKRILIPIDRHPHPEPGLEIAADMIQAVGVDHCRVELLHIGDVAEMPLVRVPSSAKSEWHSVSRTGEVVSTILTEATDTRADLIIMTTSGRHGFLDALRGSTTEQILRNAPCPVLAVHSWDDN